FLYFQWSELHVDSGAALDGHDARRRVASMPLYGQSSGSPRRFNALSSFNVRPDSPALGAIYMPMLPWASCLAGSSSLPREDCAVIVWGHRSGLTAKEVFYDAPHSCIPGAGDVHSAVVRPKQHPAHGSIWLYDRH